MVNDNQIRMIFISFNYSREDLLNNQSDPNDEQFFNSFVILSIHYLIGGLARGLRRRRCDCVE